GEGGGPHGEGGPSVAGEAGEPPVARGAPSQGTPGVSGGPGLGAGRAAAAAAAADVGFEVYRHQEVAAALLPALVLREKLRVVARELGALKGAPKTPEEAFESTQFCGKGGPPGPLRGPLFSSAQLLLPPLKRVSPKGAPRGHLTS
ncbi:hypothetical protein, conserved, partial [Eimeria tenella]